MKLYAYYYTALVLFLKEALAQSPSIPDRVKYPQVIAHRGASGYIPEHSLAAYQTAIDLGADYIEPDLCLTKDGVLVAIHDITLDDVTDVAQKFPGRNSTKTVYGVTKNAYYVVDFSYAEIQTLRLHQRLNFRTNLYDGFFSLPRFDEIMTLVSQNFDSTNFTVGIYVELKSPSWYNSLGFPDMMEDMLLGALSKAGYAVKGDGVYSDMKNVVPVVIQCFEEKSLVYLNDKTDIPLIQLVENSGSKVLNNDLIDHIAGYANGIGPEKTFFGTMEQSNAKALVDYAHSKGLYMHPWTFRSDSGILPKFMGSFEAEQAYFYECLGMDALFTEFPDRSREGVDDMLSGSYYFLECEPKVKSGTLLHF